MPSEPRAACSNYSHRGEQRHPGGKGRQERVFSRRQRVREAAKRCHSVENQEQQGARARHYLRGGLEV